MSARVIFVHRYVWNVISIDSGIVTKFKFCGIVTSKNEVGLVQNKLRIMASFVVFFLLWL